MKALVFSLMAVGMILSGGCSSSSRSQDSGVMAMHCSKCDADMKADSTMKCKCGADVKVGDLKVECPKCGAEARMADCHGTCEKCGASISQANCKVKCPKCGGQAKANALYCPRCDLK